MFDNLIEANKCIVCKNARCQKNCPIDTPIPQIISLYKEGKYEEAGKILFENNPLSAICAIVCPHENQCKGNCIKGIKGEPVRFHDIEYEISTKYLENIKLEKPKQNGVKVAVVGSGPAGITVALNLALRGYSVTIFEKNERIGGILTYGIPAFRLPRFNISLLEKRLKELGVKIKFNALIGPVVTLSKLFEDGYKSIFIGTGVWNPRRLDIKGETFGHVHYAIDYLRSPNRYDLGNKVVVIGAGNVAMDAARSAKYFGANEVYVAYRRGFENMTATKHEISEAKEEGVLFKTFKAPYEIVDDGIIFEDTKLIENEDGTTSLVTVEDSKELFECDSILIAVSQSPKNTIVINNKGLDVKKGGLLLTDEAGLTTREGVYACGDVTNGAKTVIQAVVDAKNVCDSMDKYLQQFIDTNN
ncbi:NAD(P)-dependent oxidoreductase [Romboutsia lituseburensis]|uniref:Glutamate synthase (NADPH/NADH) small chain n=1 Tax=Romboutsia lituseburensis DSM 797 TaxID=1121325 RepID=A0A1G9JBJ4_9FIRM|nr:NAD(P)-dependent oxidoreductase [Romboutsia lituseburensis]CEH33554.1 Sulfide dehydrogenase subunit alpha [Romboutsia lituseburensis]SDL34788.1 glutamate synthase (NADPH/NADH) small chain [Romboutsia lituseburensis DSM 797]